MRTTRKTSVSEVESEVKNCFMFDEESPRGGSGTINSTILTERYMATEFRTDKPYRLALYVHPSTKRRVNFSDSKLLANLTQIRQGKDKENKPRRAPKTRDPKDNINVTLFDEENPHITNCGKKNKKLADQTPANGEKPSKISKKGILAYVNINEPAQKKTANEEIESSLSKTKPKTVGRAYTKKKKDTVDNGITRELCLKETDGDKTISEKYLNQNSEDATEEKDTKKDPRANDKEKANEDEEFQKWAESINSDFEEVDKFELSITYD